MSCERAAELSERVWPDAVELADLGLGRRAQLFQSGVSRRFQRSPRRAGKLLR